MCFGGLLPRLFRRRKQSSASSKNVSENHLLNVHPSTSGPPVGVPIAAHSLTTPHAEVPNRNLSREVSGTETSKANVSLIVKEEQVGDTCVSPMKNHQDDVHAEATRSATETLGVSMTDGKDVPHTYDCRSRLD
jgi:hypothetical protein